jgi:cyclase
MRQLTASVYVDDRVSTYPKFRGCNPGFVTTSGGIVMIDSPMLPTDALQWREELARRGRVRFIVNTHHHLDHMGGNYFFQADVVSHEGCQEMYHLPLTRELDSEVPGEPAKLVTLEPAESYRLRIKELDPDGVPLLDRYQVTGPTITFSERLTLHIGDHTFELMHVPGHTRGDLCVYIPQEGVLFAGDNFTNGLQPSLAQCLPLQWVESLKRIEALDADRIVPGHGRVGGKKEVQEFRLFIQKCIEIVNGAIQSGMSKEEAADRLSFLDFCVPVHPGPWQQRMNVLRIYEELTGQRRE